MNPNAKFYPQLLANMSPAIFRPGGRPLRRHLQGGLNWEDPYEHFGNPYGIDLVEQLLEIGYLTSPRRAPLSHEPQMREQFGPPAVDNYGKLRLPDANIPLNWRLREIAPWWGGEQEEKPRPGGAPSGLYDFPVIGKATGSQYRPAQKQRASQKIPQTRFGEEMSMKSWIGDLVKELSRALTQKPRPRGAV